MKKLIVIALAVVMALSVIAFAACGGEKTYEGEYSYAHPYAPDSGAKYGAKLRLPLRVALSQALLLKLIQTHSSTSPVLGKTRLHGKMVKQHSLRALKV